MKKKIISIPNNSFSVLFLTFLSSIILSFSCFTEKVFAFPIYAQQAYQNPREANGRIVCANCHLAHKPTEFEAPTSVLPDSVFETVVKIPYDLKSKQILGNGQKGGLNVGAVVILPESFKLAPKTRLDEELKTKTMQIYVYCSYFNLSGRNE
jgi:apocytochrome f